MNADDDNLDASAGLLSLKLLRLFDLIYTTQSVTRAADQLGQSLGGTRHRWSRQSRIT